MFERIKEIITLGIIEEVHLGNIFSRIREEAQWDNCYFWMLILSSVIATCGLLVNNNAVIIGAMVIAPLSWPLLAVSLSIARGDAQNFFSSFGILFLSIIFALITSILIGFVIPFNNLTPEILSRISPSFVDIIIALAAGIVAALSVRWEKVSNTIAGVAMAASLLPPLCTIGIGIGMKNSEVVYGSGLLFFGNLLTIILISSIVFRILGFRPHRAEEEGNQRVYFAISMALFLLFLIPFGYFVKTSYEKELMKSESIKILANEIEKIHYSGRLRNFYMQNYKDYIYIEADVLFPEDTAPKYRLERIVDKALEKKWGKSAVVKFNIIPILTDKKGETPLKDSILPLLD